MNDLSIEDFTTSERNFMEQHNLSPDDFYDGRNQGQNERHDNAKRANKLYVLSSVPCKDGGHRLRTRSGHCIQCKTGNIKYIKRYHTSGVIYLATTSEKSNWYKVGLVEDNKENASYTLSNRQGSLNGEGGYGGVKGWKIIDHFPISGNLGKVEEMIHKELEQYSIKPLYIHSRQQQEAEELFCCDKSIVEATIHKILSSRD